MIVQETDANVTSILEEGVDALGHHHQCHRALGEAGCGCACGVGAHWREGDVQGAQVWPWTLLACP